MLKKYGKSASEWRKVRANWVKLNPPNHEGYYLCGICAKSVSADDMELDHINPRSGDPASSSDFTNLQPTHSYCNRRKGSVRLVPLVSKTEYELRQQLKL